jgi:hypothetical protein
VRITTGILRYDPIGKCWQNEPIEISDTEWDEIGVEYQGFSNMYAYTSDWKPFSKYLKELISLRAK